MTSISIEPLTAEAFRPYGSLLDRKSDLHAFSNPLIDFWEDNIFNPGTQGETQILWINYRDTHPQISQLESHRLTHQAVIPLTGDIIQIVATSPTSTPKAFRIPQGQAICMNPGCFHTTRVIDAEVRALMLTRRSTTADLIAHLTSNSPLAETSIIEVPATTLCL